jgi:DNA mismatch repair ATPase MutL
VDEHAELFGGIRYAIGELGGFSFELGGRRFYLIQVAEKVGAPVRLIVRGPGGHGSMPMRGGAMARLGTVLRRLEERRPSSQMFLIPHVVELGPDRAAAFEPHEAWLHSLGFEGERFGPLTIRLNAAPAELPEHRVNPVFERLLEDLAEERTPDRRLHETAALIACHSAVRFGDAMPPDSAAQLLSSLALTAEPISCPHGRPTTLILPDHQLRRLFKRP